jgi:hypothetical protein
MPVIPFVRLKRVLRHVFRSGRAHELLPHILPALMLGQAADAFGQLMATLLELVMPQRMVGFELNRCQHDVMEQERASRKVFAKANRR